MTRSRLLTWERRGAERVASLSAHRVASPVGARIIPRALRRRFDPDAARGLDATLELTVGATVLALHVHDGDLDVRPGPAEQPSASATLALDDLVRLAGGAIGWPELLAAERMTFTGDPFLALRFPALFRLPAG